MQELAQIEGHGLSPQMELAEKFTNLHTHIIETSEIDKTVQHTETHVIMMDLAILFMGILLLCMHNLILPEN